MVQFSNGQALAMAMAIVLTIQNPDILSGFQIVFDNMAAICLDFKWLGFRISDAIRNPDHWQPNLFWTIRNGDKVGFQIPSVHRRAL